MGTYVLCHCRIGLGIFFLARWGSFFCTVGIQAKYDMNGGFFS
jgi:hypothetical protein